MCAACDFGSEVLHFGDEVFVASVDVLYVGDFGFSVGCEACADECGSCPEVCCCDGCSGEFGDSFDDCAASSDADVGSHSVEFVYVAESAFVDVFGDDAGALCDGEECCEGLLHVGWESGMGHCFDVGRPECSVALYVEFSVGFGDVYSDFVEFAEDGPEVFCVYSLYVEVAVCDGCCDGEGSCFHSVCDDVVFASVEAFYAVDGDGGCSVSLYVGSHGVEEVCEVDDFGFCGAVFDDGCAFCEGSCGDEVLCGSCALEVEVDACSVEFGCFCAVDAVFDVYFGSEFFESVDVEVDGSCSDVASSWYGHSCEAEACEEWAEDAEGGSHFAYEFVGCFEPLYA